MGTRARRPASEVGHGDAKPPVDQSGTQLGEVRLDTSMALGEISSHDEQMIEGRHGKTLDPARRLVAAWRLERVRTPE